MESYNLAAVTKSLYDSPFSLFTTKSLRDLWGSVIAPSSLFSLISRLEEHKVLHRLERNKYSLAGRVVHDFLVANFLYEPSCVSLQTALNFQGVLPQFPYEITSVTPKKSITKSIDGKVFRYVHIKNTLFWGYDLHEGILMAQPEKALLDLIYLKTKGLATVHMDDYTIEGINKSRYYAYAKQFPLSRKDILL